MQAITSASARSAGHGLFISIRRPTAPSRCCRRRRVRRTATTQRRLKSGTTSTSTSTTTTTTTTTTTPTTQPTESRRSLRQLVQASPIGRFGRFYGRAQEKRPYVTQLCSSLVVYLCGDLSAQLLFPSDGHGHVPGQEGSEGSDGEMRGGGGGYDPLRTLRHLTVGLVSSIPSYKWFMFLHHHFNYASKPLSILAKVCVQQACFTPVFNTYFFSMQSLLAGASLEETWARLQKAVPTSIKNSVKLWPAVTAFSFLYVPPHFRSVFGGTVAVGWQTYLSWLNQKAAREVAAAEAAAAAAAQRGVAAGSEVSQAQAVLR
ncbi:hypothetical protein VTN02DRAFT_469 [Thermoascus thermophilus]